MNVKRLTILRNALIRYAKDEGNLAFDLATFASIPAAYRDNFMKAILGAKRGANYCGTTACACGLASTIPSFRRDGLRLTEPIFSWDRGVGLEYAGHSSWNAIRVFFDIDGDDAFQLFDAEAYSHDERKNPVAVADRITALLHTA